MNIYSKVTLAPTVLPDTGQLQSVVPVGPSWLGVSCTIGSRWPCQTSSGPIENVESASSIRGRQLVRESTLIGCSASESVQRGEEAAQAFSRIIHVNVKVTYLVGE